MIQATVTNNGGAPAPVPEPATTASFRFWLNWAGIVQAEAQESLKIFGNRKLQGGVRNGAALFSSSNIVGYEKGDPCCHENQSDY